MTIQKVTTQEIRLQLILATLVVAEHEAMQAWPEEATVPLPAETMAQVVGVRS